MNGLISFQDKTIRRELIDGEWFLSIVDIVGILTDSPNPASYWNKVRKTIVAENSDETHLLRIWQKVKMRGLDGKMYPTDCANTEGVFRIIMSVPSPKAEPFKLWLAQVAKEHIDEIENPELAIDRAREIYKAKGYTEEWINARLKSIDVRQKLTDEWKNRGVETGQEYAILTAEIAKATFGLLPSEHAKIKGLERQNLRDHMTDLELIFSMLGEATTTEIAVNEDAQGFDENHHAAVRGGTLAGEARQRVEAGTGKKIVSDTNFLPKIAASQTDLLPPKTDEIGTI